MKPFFDDLVLKVDGPSAPGRYGQAEGDIRRLSHGFDFAGNLCGVAPGVEHKKMTCPRRRRLVGEN